MKTSSKVCFGFCVYFMIMFFLHQDWTFFILSIVLGAFGYDTFYLIFTGKSTLSEKEIAEYKEKKAIQKVKDDENKAKREAEAKERDARLKMESQANPNLSYCPKCDRYTVQPMGMVKGGGYSVVKGAVNSSIGAAAGIATGGATILAGAALGALSGHKKNKTELKFVCCQCGKQYKKIQKRVL